MNILIRLNSKEVNYFDFELYLISNCERMFSPVRITEGASLFDEDYEIGQLKRYEFEDLADVDVSEYYNDSFSIRVVSPNYEKGNLRLNELKGVLGLARRTSF